MKERFLFDYLISSLSSDMRSSHLHVPKFAVHRQPSDIWEQMIFCILSSQFSALRAATISSGLLREVPFFDFLLRLQKIEEACFRFLSRPGVGYRFPKSRALQISLCWFPFAQIMDEYQEYICSFASERQAREQITERFPGIGLKQASMFLRNTGAARNLAIIDAHMLSYLRIYHGWNVGQLTPKRYLQAEDILRNDAAHHGLELNTFDTIVWSAARALKKASLHV